MKSSLLRPALFTIIAAFFASTTTNAAVIPSQESQTYVFQFKATKAKGFSISQKASSKEAAFKLAAAACFRKLTGDTYPGEEKGLEIIDICANPKM